MVSIRPRLKKGCEEDVGDYNRYNNYSRVMFLLLRRSLSKRLLELEQRKEPYSRYYS